MPVVVLPPSAIFTLVPAPFAGGQPTFERPGLKHRISDPMACLPVDANSSSSLAIVTAADLAMAAAIAGG